MIILNLYMALLQVVVSSASQDIIATISLIKKMQNFKNSANVSPKWASAMGIKCFWPEKHTVVVAQPGFEPGSLALKPRVLTLHQLLP